ncbi:MAG: sigma-70 family RNA polymerase sigma factor [Chitinophagaceae bacterium]|nr:sigma-70 family RNA polymerase sigma factor [Chitinophagaceae bacterium]
MKDYQSILFPYAYNILGSSEDAKDAVQDVLYKYLASPKEGIENEKNYLIRSVINQSINIKKSKKKIVPDDVWLPEPIATEKADTNINLSDIVTYSLMVLMEQLTPKERAVFILKEGFGYSHEEIAGLLSGTVENSRKLLSRAKTKLDAPRHIRPQHATPFPKDLLEKFAGAIQGGDVHTLEALLTEDIRYTADGGEKIKVLSKLTIGQKDVAGLLLLVHQRFHQKASFVYAMVNHQPAFLYYQGEKLFQCQVFSITSDGTKISQIDNVIDPAKLKAIYSSGL